MAIKDVTDLRKAGRLDEAYTMAVSELEESSNEWTQMSLFWVLHDKVKLLLSSSQTHKALELMSSMRPLLETMKDDSGQGKETYGWIIYRLLKEHRRRFSLDQIRSLLKEYIELRNNRPSLLHSQILILVQSFREEYQELNFVNFIRRWGIQNFRAEDWQKVTSDQGHTYPTLATKIAGICFELVKGKEPKEEGAILWLEEFFELLKKRQAMGEWDLRKLANLKLWLGKREEAIALFKQAILELSHRYFVWEDLASCVDDRKLKIGLLLYGKSLERDEKFLGDIHLALAKVWIEEGRPEDSQRELQLYANTRQKEGWKLPQQHQHLLQLANTTSATTGKKLSEQEYIDLAFDFVYQEYGWEEFALVDKRKDKDPKRGEQLLFANIQGESFWIREKRFSQCRNLRFGDIVKFRCKPQESGAKGKGSVSPLVAEKTNSPRWSALSKGYGVVDYINTEKNIAHIATTTGQLIFHPLGKHTLQAGDLISGYVYTLAERDQTKIAGLAKCPREEVITQFPTLTGVVDHINTDKGVFHIIFTNKAHTLVKLERIGLHPKVGDLLLCSYCKVKNKRGVDEYLIVEASRSQVPCPSLKKTITGEIRIMGSDGKVFGFVDDYYVSGEVIRKHHLQDGQIITLQLVYTKEGRWTGVDIL